MLDYEECVGFISIFAHSLHIMSLGIDIREQYKREGYGSKAMLLAEEIAVKKGYGLFRTV